MIRIIRLTGWGVLFTALSLSAIAQETMTPDEAKEASAISADRARLKAATMTFEQFMDSVYIEELPDGRKGKYIVAGDTPISDVKALKDYFDNNVVKKASSAAKFAVHTRGGVDAVWSEAQKRALTYCVSNQFPASRYTQVVSDMALATSAWESAADVNFIYLSEQDSNCTADNPDVLFDVNPVAAQRYLARAFFPGDPRRTRNVLINESSFQLSANQNLSLVGILRHELGHVIGARHEHTRPEAGQCFEDTNFRPTTDYDAFSVMHYPHCNGLGDWKLALTDIDQAGVACLYGASPWFIIDQTICAGQQTLLETQQSVSAGEFLEIGTFAVTPGRSFRVSMRNFSPGDPGDPDIYVRFGSLPPGLADYDCRPFSLGANEHCDLNVPPGVEMAHVSVHGYTDGNFDIWIAYK